VIDNHLAEAGNHSSNGAETQSPFYIQAPSPLADEQTRVLMHGDTFAVFDHHGDVKPSKYGEEGLYHNGTRYLSCLILLFGKNRPLFLSSTVRENNDHLTVDLTNPDLLDGERVVVPRGTLHIFRNKFLWCGACYELIRIKNFGLAAVELSFSVHFRADFIDIFEVRGIRPSRRGRHLGASVDDRDLVLGYQGLDGVRRRTRLIFDPKPDAVLGTEAFFRSALAPGGETVFQVIVSCEQGQSAPAALPYETALARAAEELQTARDGACNVLTSDVRFNNWINRGMADLFMMTAQTPAGPYPYAGVPWFSAPFGRDGIITALECLWFNPALARGVLAFLASTQALDINPVQDAEPGKILHEARGGEMAALGEVPFQRYYGSIDATPLFVWLAGAYYRRTADHDFIAAIWPNIERALQWIDAFGDRDGDGFVEYLRNSPKGLVQQGWKDSHDSVHHADGTLAQGPIALCEVQGYVYAARLAAAELADALGDGSRAGNLREDARKLRARFQEAFWCGDQNTFALALDGDKRPCRVRSSNVGHCLWTGITEPEYGRRCGRSLLEDRLFTGWGIRTLAHDEARYNPMSYHNGSVWPHDNAIAAAGLARYGLRVESTLVLRALFDVSQAVDLNRLPELFCGFHRRSGEGPTRYPVACAPQAWAAAAVFLLLETCLGMSIKADPPEVRFTAPSLPESIGEVRIDKLRVGPGSVDLRITSQGDSVQLQVLRQEGNLDVQLRQ
jgi:glycogen debranching enzyme